MESSEETTSKKLIKEFLYLTKKRNSKPPHTKFDWEKVYKKYFNKEVTSSRYQSKPYEKPYKSNWYKRASEYNPKTPQSTYKRTKYQEHPEYQQIWADSDGTQIQAMSNELMSRYNSFSEHIPSIPKASLASQAREHRKYAQEAAKYGYGKK